MFSVIKNLAPNIVCLSPSLVFYTAVQKFMSRTLAIWHHASSQLALLQHKQYGPAASNQYLSTQTNRMIPKPILLNWNYHTSIWRRYCAITSNQRQIDVSIALFLRLWRPQHLSMQTPRTASRRRGRNPRGQHG